MIAATSLVLAGLAGLAAAAPVDTSASTSCISPPASSFHLGARLVNGTVRPLTASFPAEFTGSGTDLNLYASSNQPYNRNETSIFAYDSTRRAIMTESKARANPDGSAVPFYTPFENVGQSIFMTSGGNSTSAFTPSCEGTPAFAYSGSAQAVYALCDGDAVDKEIGRKKVYLNPAEGTTTTNCESMMLVPQ